MRICILTPEYIPNWGGVGTYSAELAKAIQDKVEVHVVTMLREYEVKSLSKRDVVNERINLHIIGRASAKDTFFFNASFQQAVLRRLPALIRDYGFDLVHTHFPAMPDILLKMTGAHYCKDLVTIHTTISGHKNGIISSGLPFNMLDRSEKFTLLLYPALVLSEELYLRRSTHFITVSDWMRNRILKAYPFIREVDVVPRGVDTERFCPAKQSSLIDGVEGKVVLFSSRLTATKGVHVLIRAIPAILNSCKDVHFVFSGSGSTHVWMRMLDRLNVDKRFYTFLGYVDYDLLPALYAGADVFVSVGLYENLPARILEAMSCGVAVVALNVGGVSEVIKDKENGLLISTPSPKMLANSLILLLQDKDLRSKLARNARETVLRHFSLSMFGDKMLRVYEHTLTW